MVDIYAMIGQVWLMGLFIASADAAVQVGAIPTASNDNSHVWSGGNNRQASFFVQTRHRSLLDASRWTDSQSGSSSIGSTGSEMSDFISLTSEPEVSPTSELSDIEDPAKTPTVFDTQAVPSSDASASQASKSPLLEPTKTGSREVSIANEPDTETPSIPLSETSSSGLTELPISDDRTTEIPEAMQPTAQSGSESSDTSAVSLSPNVTETSIQDPSDSLTVGMPAPNTIEDSKTQSQDGETSGTTISPSPVPSIETTLPIVEETDTPITLESTDTPILEVITTRAPSDSPSTETTDAPEIHNSDAEPNISPTSLTPEMTDEPKVEVSSPTPSESPASKQNEQSDKGTTEPVTSPAPLNTLPTTPTVTADEQGQGQTETPESNSLSEELVPDSTETPVPQSIPSESTVGSGKDVPAVTKSGSKLPEADLPEFDSILENASTPIATQISEAPVVSNPIAASSGSSNASIGEDLNGTPSNAIDAADINIDEEPVPQASSHERDSSIESPANPVAEQSADASSNTAVAPPVNQDKETEEEIPSATPNGTSNNGATDPAQVLTEDTSNESLGNTSSSPSTIPAEEQIEDALNPMNEVLSFDSTDTSEKPTTDSVETPIIVTGTSTAPTTEQTEIPVEEESNPVPSNPPNVPSIDSTKQPVEDNPSASRSPLPTNQVETLSEDATTSLPKETPPIDTVEIPAQEALSTTPSEVHNTSVTTSGESVTNEATTVVPSDNPSASNLDGIELPVEAATNDTPNDTSSTDPPGQESNVLSSDTASPPGIDPTNTFEGEQPSKDLNDDPMTPATDPAGAPAVDSSTQNTPNAAPTESSHEPSSDQSQNSPVSNEFTSGTHSTSVTDPPAGEVLSIDAPGSNSVETSTGVTINADLPDVIPESELNSEPVTQTPESTDLPTFTLPSVDDGSTPVVISTETPTSELEVSPNEIPTTLITEQEETGSIKTTIPTDMLSVDQPDSEHIDSIMSSTNSIVSGSNDDVVVTASPIPVDTPAMKSSASDISSSGPPNVVPALSKVSAELSLTTHSGDKDPAQNPVADTSNEPISTSIAPALPPTDSVKAQDAFTLTTLSEEGKKRAEQLATIPFKPDSVPSPTNSPTLSVSLSKEDSVARSAVPMPTLTSGGDTKATSNSSSIRNDESKNEKNLDGKAGKDVENNVDHSTPSPSTTIAQLSFEAGSNTRSKPDNEITQAVVLNLNSNKTEEPKVYVRGQTSISSLISGGNQDIAGNDGGFSNQPIVIGGRNRGAASATALGMSTASVRFYTFVRTAASVTAGIAVGLLAAFHFLYLDVTLQWPNSNWSPNSWEFLVFVTYLQQAMCFSQLTLLKTPYFLWEFTDSFSWTNFLVAQNVGAGGATRRLQTIILDTMVGYGDRIGIDEAHLLYHVVTGFVVTMLVVLICYVVAVMVVKCKGRENTSPSSTSDSNGDTLTEQSFGTDQRFHLSNVDGMRSIPIRIIGLGVLVWYFALYPLSLTAFFELSMEVQSIMLAAGPMVVALLAILGVCAGGLIAGARVVLHRSEQRLREFSTAAVWGVFYLNYEYRARLFFVFGASIQFLTGMSVGVLGSSSTLVLMLVLHAFYLVATYIIDPFTHRLFLKRVTYVIGCIKILNCIMGLAFLPTSEISEINRDHVANAVIGINSLVILCWFIRLLIVFSTVVTVYSVRDNVESPSTSLTTLYQLRIKDQFRNNDALSEMHGLVHSVPLTAPQQPVSTGQSQQWRLVLPS